MTERAFLSCWTGSFFTRLLRVLLLVCISCVALASGHPQTQSPPP